MPGQSTTRWLQLSFLLMASTASAGSLKLSDFESISDKSFPSNCAQAYDTPLSQCTPGDFTGGKACSAACKDSVQQAQVYIQASCSEVSTSSESLLSRGQKGNLVAVLCRDVDEPQTQQPAPQPEPETQAASTTTPPASATKVMKNVLIETSHSSIKDTSDGSLNGPPLSSVDEDLATKSTVLAIDTEQPTGSLPIPNQMVTSVTKAASPSHTAQATTAAPTPTPAEAAGAVQVPSLRFVCASFVMSAVMYMVI
ncbi:hypothetical protein QYS62_009014 [Fusarium acuminatum]|uniref:Extracellular membrane protein CFEM domain-containing protein n=1 Tax=Fusarium acuminatum TaxID=5515 RepID=A0ABZ2X435_9HYPO